MQIEKYKYEYGCSQSGKYDVCEYRCNRADTEGQTAKRCGERAKTRKLKKKGIKGGESEIMRERGMLKIRTIRHRIWDPVLAVGVPSGNELTSYHRSFR